MKTPIDKIKEHLGIWQGVDERATPAPWNQVGSSTDSYNFILWYRATQKVCTTYEEDRSKTKVMNLSQQGECIIPDDSRVHNLLIIKFLRNTSTKHRQVIEKLVEALTSIEERLKALPEVHKVIDSISRLTDIEVGLAKEAFDISQKLLVECAEILEKGK